MNDKLLETAIEKGLTCKFYGRRMHAVIGIPIQLDHDHLRLYIKTTNNIVSILLGDISAYEFPIEVTKDVELETPEQEKYVCAQCGKDITEQVNSEQEFFQFHGLEFCNKKCYDKYLKKL